MTLVLLNVVPYDGTGVWPEPRYLVIDDGIISRVGPMTSWDRRLADQRDGYGVSLVDMRGKVAIPGAVNAHAHNNELYLRGSLWGMALEPYILYNSPRGRRGAGVSPDDVYQRTLAACVEMIGSGITAVADDVAHSALRREDVEAVLTAYRDAGMRARVSIAVEDQPWRVSIPVDSPEAAGDPRFAPPPGSGDRAIALYESLMADWGPRDQVGLMVSPSAPQRCSPPLLRRLASLARRGGLPFHIHVQETSTQFHYGPELFNGRTMIRYLFEEGLLGPETTIAHAIWVSDDDLRCVAHSGATVAHNPVSNLKLGSGVARVRDMRALGIPVSLGTDGLTCNDALDMFEVRKTAALLSCIASMSGEDWLSPAEVLAMSSAAGARANGFADVGSLEVGSAADIAFLDPWSPAFVPRNDLATQLVFSARSRDVTDVVIAGRFVLADRKYQTIDVRSVHQHVTEAAQRFQNDVRDSIADNLTLEPAVLAGLRARMGQLNAWSGVYRVVPHRLFSSKMLHRRNQHMSIIIEVRHSLMMMCWGAAAGSDRTADPPRPDRRAPRRAHESR